jgi:basic membrane protein A
LESLTAIAVGVNFSCTPAFGSSLLLKACSTNATQISQSDDSAEGGGEAFRVAIALPGVISDQAWNQPGYEGVTLAKEKLSAETADVEQVPQPDQAERHWSTRR